jgi:two-component system sensor histidine kinase/response regulator
LASKGPQAKSPSNEAPQSELLERLSVAVQAAGLTCWEFSYLTQKFTWLEERVGDAAEKQVDIDVANRLLTQSILPEDAEAMRIATLKALDEGAQALSTRMRRIGPDGRIQHCQVYQRFFRDGAGRPLRALGATRDITEEVEASERLKEQAQRLHEAQQRVERASFSVQEGHWEFDVRTRKHWASFSYYALLGYAPGEIVLDTIDAVRDIVHPEDNEQSVRAARAHMHEGKEHDVELRIRCKDGEYRWFRLRGNAQRDVDGVATLLSGSIQDIQKQKLAEDALRATQERLERAIHGTQDGLWEVDLAAGKMWMSPRMYELLGFQVGELGDGNHVLRERVHPDDLAISDEAVRRNIEEHRGIDMEVRMRMKSGEYRWFRMRGTPDAHSLGAQHRASGSMQDVTEARAARDALIRASEAAQAANKAKSAFLANVSHEIRTPMNGIIGMTSLLLDTPLDQTQREYADTIRGSADSLLTVINDLLDFSKIEAGKLDIESIEMDLPGNIENIGATMAFQAAAKGLELIIDVHPDVPARVMGDPQRIRQCLINLLGNAIKFTRTGEIAVEVSVVERQREHAQVRFEVRDSGIGIAPDTVKSLFQPFVQADSSTTRHFGGTGLGLSIVRRLVEMMGGQVAADSVLGQGSRFWFTLPMQQVQALAAPAEGAAKRAGRRVLIVDDNETNRRVLATHLTHAGYDVKLASGGREALLAMRGAIGNSRPFDLVIADFMMPDMDGAMLGEQINSDPHLSRARVVLLTSMDRHGDIRRFAAMGFAGYLSKPVKARELLVCLDKVLARDAHDFHAQTQPMVTSNTFHEHSVAQRFSGRVLLVEDNIVNQKVARRFLERLGCEVTLAENGVESVTAWERDAFEIVLMDVQMPVMDGYTATREIRDRERGQGRGRVPIVALTANAMTGQLERCLEAGMDALLTKPIAVEALQDVLERYGLALTADPASLDPTTVAEIITAVPESSPIDLAQLRELAGDDAEFIRSIAESFASSSAQLLAQLRAAAAAGDALAMAKAAHALKGASANLYAEKLRDQSAELEHGGGKFSRPNLEAKIAAMTRETERVCAALHGLATSTAASAVG